MHWPPRCPCETIGTLFGAVQIFLTEGQDGGLNGACRPQRDTEFQCREGIERASDALGVTIKGRPLNDARSKNTATAYSIVCNAALSLSLSFAVVALHVTGDCTKSASRDRQMRQICPNGHPVAVTMANASEWSTCVCTALKLLKSLGIVPRFPVSGTHSRILFVVAHDILVLCKM